MLSMLRLVGLSAAALLMIVQAGAQPLNYDVKTINFDLWCQEQANLPPSRCDKRLPEDEQRYETFRNTIEKYEVSHLKDRQKEKNFDSTILHNDPVDEPPTTQNSKPDVSTKTNPPS
jgi:hypothetical protein